MGGSQSPFDPSQVHLELSSKTPAPCELPDRVFFP